MSDTIRHIVKQFGDDIESCVGEIARILKKDGKNLTKEDLETITNNIKDSYDNGTSGTLDVDGGKILMIGSSDEHLNLMVKTITNFCEKHDSDPVELIDRMMAEIRVYTNAVGFNKTLEDFRRSLPEDLMPENKFYTVIRNIILDFVRVSARIGRNSEKLDELMEDAHATFDIHVHNETIGILRTAANAHLEDLPKTSDDLLRDLLENVDENNHIKFTRTEVVSLAYHNVVGALFLIKVLLTDESEEFDEFIQALKDGIIAAVKKM